MVSVYIKKNSIIHKTPFFIKIIFMSVFFMIINVYTNYFVLIGAIFCVGILYLIAKMSLRYLLKTLKIILPLIGIISIYNILFRKWYYIVEPSIRIFCSIGLANLLSLTTSLQDILKEDGFVSHGLKRYKFPVDRLRLAIHIILRSIPLIINEKDELQSASQLRGRSRNNIHIIFPLLLRVVSQSHTLVDALELRGTK